MAEITGTAGNDKITLDSVSSGVTGGPATDDADQILALAGKDTVLSGGGDDTVYGDADSIPLLEVVRLAELPVPQIIPGADKLYLGDGDDSGVGDLQDLHGGKGGADTLDGGAGRDFLVGDANQYLDQGAIGGNDKIYGGDGDDSIGGDASYITNGTGGADKIDAGAGDDYVVGDAYQMAAGAVGGKDSILGGDGDDALYGDAQYFTSAKAMPAPAAVEPPITGGDDTIHGGAGNDSVVGDAGNSSADGIGGNDKLYGDDGDDFLYGDTAEGEAVIQGGNDILNGGDGDDEIWSGSGTDTMIGGTGADRFAFFTGDGRDTIKDFHRGEDGVILQDDLLAVFNELDINHDEILNSQDDGVTASGKKITIDFTFNTDAPGADTLTITGVNDLRLTDLTTSGVS